MINTHAKAVPEAIAELKNELKEFLATRVGMLRAETSENLRTIRMAAPVMLIGISLLATAWLLFTAFLVSIIVQAFAPSQWAYAFSFILVAALYIIVGGAAAYLGWRRLRANGLKPKRTLHVLKQDRIWLQTEARTQL